MVDRIAINDLVPGILLDDVAGGRFGAEDGYGDPRNGDRVTGVRTDAREFSANGFMHAPATARLLVEEMLDRRGTTLDIGDLSLERFQTGRRPFSATVL